MGEDGAREKTSEIGGCELLERIGQGAMGVVYKARQTSMDRLVAVKILKPALSRNEAFVARFLREARAAARLNHPNVVQGIAAGQEGGYHYFVMEYIDGPTVAERLRAEGRFSEAEALRIARDIAAALAHAEQAGIVHRDIKPSNLMLTSAGAAKLADLGLARRADDEGTLTLEGSAMGTPYYMSPEQARGETGLDVRTDIYALGATLFHMVTGTPPFSGETAAVIVARRLSEPTPNPRERKPDLSLSVTRLILTMMAKDKAERFETAAELLDAIERVQRGEVIPARPTTKRRRPVRRPHRPAHVRRRSTSSAAPWIFAGLGVLVLVVAIAFMATRGPGRGGAEAQLAFQNAEALASQRPDDFDSAIAALHAVRTRYPGTRWASLAAELIAGLERQKAAAYWRAFMQLRMARNSLTQVIADHVSRDCFGDALAAIEAFARQHDSQSAASSAAEARRDVLAKADARYDTLARSADQALAAKDYAKARAALGPALAFGIDAITAKARARLAGIERLAQTAAKPEPGEWVSLFDGKTLDGWEVVDGGRFATHGTIAVENGQIVFGPCERGYTGLAWRRAFPTTSYELVVEAMRTDGRYFANIVFPVGDSHCIWQIGMGAAGKTVGLTDLDDREARWNITTRNRAFDLDRWYRLRLRVTDAAVQGWIDDEQVLDVPRAGHKFTCGRAEFQGCKPLGLYSHTDARVVFRGIRLRTLGAGAVAERVPELIPEPPAAEPQARLAPGPWVELLGGQSLRGWKRVEGREFAADADVQVTQGALVLRHGQQRAGIRYTQDFPATDYEVEIEARHVAGPHFMCTIAFPIDDSSCSLVVGGAGDVIGLAMVDGVAAAENPASRKMKLSTTSWHAIRLRVTKARVEAWVNGQQAIDVPTATHRLTLHPRWEAANSFAIGTGWQSGVAVRSIRARRLRREAEPPVPTTKPDPEPLKPPDEPPKPGGWRSLFDGTTLEGCRVVEGGEFAQHGRVTVAKGCIALEQGRPATGIAWTGRTPRIGYELELEAMRIEGGGCVCEVVFPVDVAECVFTLGADKGTVISVRDVDGHGATGNPTTLRVPVVSKRWYSVRLRVTAERIQAWVERKQVIDLAVARHDLTVPSRVADLAPLGFYAWDASSAVRGIRMRALEGAATAIGVLESVAGPTTRTVTAGGRGGGGYSDRGDGKGVLVGLDYRLFQWAGHPCIKALRPVFRTPDGPTRGAWHGGSGSYRSILARPGYAVGGMTAVSGSRVDGFQLTFMRVRGDRLDPRDSYQSPWLGGKGGGATDLAGSGNPVVGIHGRHGLDLDAVGLIELSPPHRP